MTAAPRRRRRAEIVHPLRDEPWGVRRFFVRDPTRDRRQRHGARHHVTRLPVRKTYKLFVGGAFPRSESGRTYEAEGANVARASRKDARDAVRAARTAFRAGRARLRTTAARCSTGSRDARGAGGRPGRVSSGAKEVETAVDRVVWYAGWADKLAQVLGVEPGGGAVLQLHRAGADRRRRDRARRAGARAGGADRAGARRRQRRRGRVGAASARGGGARRRRSRPRTSRPAS